MSTELEQRNRAAKKYGGASQETSPVSCSAKEPTSRGVVVAWLVILSVTAYFAVKRFFIVPQLEPADSTTLFKDFAHLWVATLWGYGAAAISLGLRCLPSFGKEGRCVEDFLSRWCRGGLLLVALAFGLVAIEAGAFVFQKRNNIDRPLVESDHKTPIVQPLVPGRARVYPIRCEPETE